MGLRERYQVGVGLEAPHTSELLYLVLATLAMTRPG